MKTAWELAALVGECVAEHLDSYVVEVRSERADAPPTITAHMWLTVRHADRDDERRSISHTWSCRALLALRVAHLAGVIYVDVHAAYMKLTEGLV